VPLISHQVTRRALQPTDIAIQIKFAGICHSDIHQAREEWGKASFPMVPGHEIGGVVVAVGSQVTKYKEGQHVGVGCMVDACRKCEYCRSGEEQFCTAGTVWTYNSKQAYEWSGEVGAETYGGYSESVVVDEAFVCAIPMNLDLAAATPLLCAGITTFSPLMYYGVQAHHKIAVLGLGGLGHMGVKFGVAMGCHVTVVSRGPSKKDEAMNKLGAHAFLDSKDDAAMKAAGSTFDFILDTVAAVSHCRAGRCLCSL
jgi:alcohol dehydrogenase (NADP+)